MKKRLQNLGRLNSLCSTSASPHCKGPLNFSKSSIHTNNRGLFSLITSLLFLVIGSSVSAQLGTYSFTGAATCPAPGTNVTTQPANAVFTPYANFNTNCSAVSNAFQTSNWNTATTIDLTKYNQFTITPNSGYLLTLTSLSFIHQASANSTSRWELRSSLDNYGAVITTGTGSATTTSTTSTITLPAANFTNVGAVTFRLYFIKASTTTTTWRNDNVSLFGSVVQIPANPGNPTSNSPQCASPGVTLTRSGTPAAGITWFWQTSPTGTATTSSAATYNVTTSGTYYIRARNNTSLAWSNGAGSLAVVITPNVTTPIFTLGSTSTRCQGAGSVTYDATATNTTGITYTLDPTSTSAGNTINSTSGVVTYASTWSGTSTITAIAAGCVPQNSVHTVTVTPVVGTPAFALGSSSIYCHTGNPVAYTATATNSTSITYSLDAASLAAGNTIDEATGAITFAADWYGTSIITATATGCNGTSNSSHTISINRPVTAPVFATDTSTRCQGAGSVAYTATADYTTGITYTLDLTSRNAGNTINATTGVVTYTSGWSGTSTITATAAGCTPQSTVHTVTITPTVGIPVFTAGPSTSRCQAAGSVTYAATATTNTGITYSLDATSLAANNTIDAATGSVTFDAAWFGTSVITATATGCNGPRSSNFTVVTNAPVTTPVFALGATSVRCQGTEVITYTASASNTTGITYTLDALSLSGGNSINATTGVVTYANSWNGVSIITASAAGCEGPLTETHTVTITATVGTPVFALATTSTRCQGAGSEVYEATATTSTGITYSLNAASITGGNTINSNTGEVTYVAGWSGTTIITATATGCNGPKTATHTVTVTATVSTPVFALGSTSTRCQNAGTVAYTATATSSTSRTYSLDALSLAGGNTIDENSGIVTYVSTWSGSSVITVTAAGCNGPSTASHTVTITPFVTSPVYSIGTTSTRCQGAGPVAYTATADYTTGITYTLDLTSRNAGNTINASTGVVTYASGWSGTSTITATAAGCTPQSTVHTVTITPTVGIPVFTAGPSTSRCQAAGSVTYAATATTNTGITYSLDATSLAANNTIDAATGSVTFDAAWFGTSVITATATGCNGPRSSNFTVVTNAPVTTPVFALGATSVRCQGTEVITYTASASNTTGITYTLDASSLSGGNSINATTGVVTYANSWNGVSIITASAAGCEGPLTETHTVTITATVGTPVFALATTSTRCQGAGSEVYEATATTSTGITYSLNAASITAGNTINSNTGEVTYVAGWSGTTIITATATGCNGPKTATHTVTVTATVSTPVFALGSTSTRCQNAGTVAYTATATSSTSRTYSLDALSLAGGNTIDENSGIVTYVSTWSGSSVITVTAAGCNGPSTASHTVTITPFVTSPVYSIGTTSTRCQGAGPVAYTATADYTTGITYTLDLTSRNAGNTINATTGVVTYTSGWSGTSTITATAAGCTPQSTVHTVTITPTVGIPVFTAGPSTSRCQAVGSVTYAATATTNTGITYSLDATSLAANNTIDAVTGSVTFDAAWFGTSVITATATGCNGPRSSNFTVVTNAPVTTPVFALGATSSRCQDNNKSFYIATASNTTGITYGMDALSRSYGNKINASTGEADWDKDWTGTTVITAVAQGCYGPQTSTHTITSIPKVTTPVFALGTSSTRCQGAGNVTYVATANNTTGITYTLNSASITAGNTINVNTGEVTYAATWTGSTTITATANGCSPLTRTHTVIITPTVGATTFTAGTSSTRCQGGNTVTYTASATNSTSRTYSIDNASLAEGNYINAFTGAVTFSADWAGTTIITATSTGCNGPSSSTHTVTVTPTVGTPVFATGASSTRCRAAGTVTYNASATSATSVTYTLDFNSRSYGNTINATTGVVTYTSTWTGTSIITATAAGCNGPEVATHSAVTNAPVTTPIYSFGTSSTRCQGAGTTTYTANSYNDIQMTYSLDATSTAAGNTINAFTGAVTYAATWSGTSVITATATGCYGPLSANHTVTVTATVAAPVFTAGAATTRCNGAQTIIYTATASTTITYSLDAATVAGGNTINTTSGAVNYVAGWVGTATITARAAGCGTPSVIHRATSTPTVSAPVFTLGSASTRCQAAGSVDYTATAANSTSITYNLDAASITAGNTINSTTGAVTYLAGWKGTSRITAVAVGCNGPATSIHTVTITDNGTPTFTLGATSTRVQASSNVTYAATTGNGSAIVYNLDAGSIAGGNSINSATGVVTYVASWFGTTTITATSTGCIGSVAVTHIVNVTPSSVIKQLYLSDPAQSLDRIDPVNTADKTTATSAILNINGTATFTQAPVLCSFLTLKTGGFLSVENYITVTTGTMPANPLITAVLKYDNVVLYTLTNPTYNSTTKLLRWNVQLTSDITVPAGKAIVLTITNNQTGAAFNINYDSDTKPSKINLPVSTYIDIQSFGIYNAPYPGGTLVTSAITGSTTYLRAVVTDPFGFNDITGLDVTITPTGTTVPATSVATSGCSRTYQYVWNSPASSGYFDVKATAKEGFENTVTSVKTISFSNCTSCPPMAYNDSATGAGGAPVTINVLANDFDPNNNINLASLVILTQPMNGNAVLSNGQIIYLPNGTFAGTDYFTYRICDSTLPTPLCATATVKVEIDPTIINACSETSEAHVYYIPFPEQDARTALIASTAAPYLPIPSNNIRTIISIKVPYPGMTIRWDHWEDGYEANILNPIQTTTKVWGDGDIYNGIAPGYSNDIIPAGGSLVFDNTMNSNPRSAASVVYDGRDKVHSSGEITLTQVLGEPSIIGVQAMKTNVSSTNEFGLSFTIPVGQNFNSQDFRYSALFIRAAENSTVVNIDKDNNGTFETTATLNEGQSLLVNGGVMTGATVTGTKPIGVDLHFGGVDGYSSREVPIYPATWYSNVYYTPVPTTKSPDTSVVMLYNNLNRPITINWTSGLPASGSVVLAPKTVTRFPLALSATNTYKFVNLTGESFTAIEIVDSYTPGTGTNSGSTFDWAFNLIAEERLTTFATIAWAPGSTNGTRNDNPIWVTPASNTKIYVKYDGDVLTGGSVSPSGLHYDVSYSLDALKYKKIFDLDNDQGGIAVFTADGTKIAAVYGEDPATASDANPSWDVGSTIKPFCAAKLVFANDDFAYSLTDRAVTIPVLLNDVGFTATIDPASITLGGFLRQPKHGTIKLNANGSLLYTPKPGYVGLDSFEYRVCSTPSVVCDEALVIIRIAGCPTPLNQNIISGQVFLDVNKDGVSNDGGVGFPNVKVYLYADANCNSVIDANELQDSVYVDSSGYYQFISYPEKTIADNFDSTGRTTTCAVGSDGNMPWVSNWVDAGDPSIGFCVTPALSGANTDAEVVEKDGNYALKLMDNNVSVTRRVNISGSTAALLSFSFKKDADLLIGEDVLVQASTNGTTFTTIYTIAGDGNKDDAFERVHNLDLTPFASTGTYIRFATNNNMDDGDEVYIDDITITYLKYPHCYITGVDTLSILQDHYVTTSIQSAISAPGGGTCLFAASFGIAKGIITISGKLFNDVNGVKDNLVNGIATGAPSGNTMYAYLVNSAGKVEFKTTVNALSGVYTFPLAEVSTNYTVVLSTSDVAVNADAPASANLPEGWVSVGDAYGTINAAGTGNETGIPDSKIAVNSTFFNVINVNFGIEQRPAVGSGMNVSMINPAGTNDIDVPKTTFHNIKISTDPSPGIVSGIRISAFPARVTTLVIDGKDFTAATFPAAGVIVPANSIGEPTKSIKMDPYDGFIKVVIPFYVIDNAGVESLVSGTATLRFLLDTDKDGIADIIDIDDDNDGITDVIEVCGNGATSFNCVAGGQDPAEDEDDDGTVNYQDLDFGALNAAGCITYLDRDDDGVPDFLDLDSDNDGIPDVVEAFGFDEDGDGIIDKFSDTDADGLAQLADLSNTGKNGSGTGLGFQDYDKDGIPNSCDLDSDGDGLPDIVEALAADVDNDGRVDNFIDTDNDGLHDPYLEDGAILKTGKAENIGDDNEEDYINGNIDQLGYPNPYDLDSDGDGLTDLVEAGFSGTNGKASGFLGADGWSDLIDARASLGLPNTDGRGLANVFDTDSDDDGISDNIEAQPTFAYRVPTDILATILTSGGVLCNQCGLVNTLYNCTNCNGTGIESGATCGNCKGTGKLHNGCSHAWNGVNVGLGINGGLTGGFSKASTNVYTTSDFDKDGIADVFEPLNALAYGGSGITPYDHDADGTPDYRDTDADNDGAPDLTEASKKLTLTQANIDDEDKDGDGLVDEFDLKHVKDIGKRSKGLNIGNSKMGALGSFAGLVESGSNATLVRSLSTGDRDWRAIETLPLQIVSFSGVLQNTTAQLQWLVQNEVQVSNYQVERSFDGLQFIRIGMVNARNTSASKYTYDDNLSAETVTTVYYRIRQVDANGKEFTTNIITLKLNTKLVTKVRVYPNPASSYITLSAQSAMKGTAQLTILDLAGRSLFMQKYAINKGENRVYIPQIANLPAGKYYLNVRIGEQVWTEKIVKQ